MSNNKFDDKIILLSGFFANTPSETYSKDSDFEHDDAGKEPLKEQSLWQSVILQAVYDATCAPLNQKARKDKTQAIIWFSNSNKDFRLVCEMAGLDPLFVISHVKRSIKHSTAIHRRKQHMKRLRLVRHKNLANSENTKELCTTNSSLRNG